MACIVFVVLVVVGAPAALAADCLGGSIAGGTTTIDLNTETAHVANLCAVSAGARYVLDASTLNSPSAGRYAVFATITQSTFSGGSGLGLLLRQPGDAASRLASAVIVHIAGNTFAGSALQITGTFPPGSRVTVTNNTLTISAFLCVLAGYCAQPVFHSALHLFPALEALTNATVIISENTATASSSTANVPITLLFYDVTAADVGSLVELRGNAIGTNAPVGSGNPHCSHMLCASQLNPVRTRAGIVNVSGDDGAFRVEQNQCTVNIASTTAGTVGMHFTCARVDGTGRGVFALRRNTVTITSVLKYMDVLTLPDMTLGGHAAVVVAENSGSVSGGAAVGAVTRSIMIRSLRNATLRDDARLVIHRNHFRALTCPDGACLAATFLDIVVTDRAALVVTANTFALPSTIPFAGYFLFTSLALPSATASVYFGRNVVSSGVVTTALVGGPMAAGTNSGTVFVCANTEAGGGPLLNLTSAASVGALVVNNCTATATTSLSTTHPSQRGTDTPSQKSPSFSGTVAHTATQPLLPTPTAAHTATKPLLSSASMTSPTPTATAAEVTKSATLHASATLAKTATHSPTPTPSPYPIAPCEMPGGVLVGSIPPSGLVRLRLPTAQPATGLVPTSGWTCDHGMNLSSAPAPCELVDGGAVVACSVGVVAAAALPVTCTAHVTIGCADITLVVTAWPPSASSAVAVVVVVGAASVGAGAAVLLLGDPTAVEMPVAATLLLGPCASFTARDTARVAAYLFSPLHTVGQPEAVAAYVGGSALLAVGYAAVVGIVAARRSSSFVSAAIRLWFPNIAFAVAATLYPGVAWAVAAIARQGGGAWAVAVGCVFLLAVPCVAAWLILRVSPAAYHEAPDLAQRPPGQRLLLPSGAFAAPSDEELRIGCVRGVVAGRGRLLVVPAWCVSVTVAWLAAGGPRGSSCVPRLYAACALLAAASVAVAVARPLRVPAANVLSVGALAGASLTAFGVAHDQPVVFSTGAVVVAVASMGKAAVTLAARVIEHRRALRSSGPTEGEAEMALAEHTTITDTI